jgi:hypothetical protein
MPYAIFLADRPSGDTTRKMLQEFLDKYRLCERIMSSPRESRCLALNSSSESAAVPILLFWDVSIDARQLPAVREQRRQIESIARFAFERC